MCTVHTSRIGFKGAGALDTTVKSAQGIGKVFASTWTMVGGYKSWQGCKTLSADDYTTLYYELMRQRYQENAQAFIDLLRQDTLVILCYCQANTFCHRHLLVDILEKIAAAKRLPLTRGHEKAIQ